MSHTFARKVQTSKSGGSVATRTAAVQPAAPDNLHADVQRLGGAYALGPAVALRAGVQTKLAVGQVGDPYEREADKVADRAASGQPAGEVSRIPPGGLAAQRLGDEPADAATPPPAVSERAAEPPGEADVGADTSSVQRRREEEDERAQSREKPGQRSSARRKCAACEARENAQRTEDPADTDDDALQACPACGQTSVHKKEAAGVGSEPARPTPEAAGEDMQRQEGNASPEPEPAARAAGADGGVVQRQAEGGESGEEAEENEEEQADDEAPGEDAQASECDAGEGGGRGAGESATEEAESEEGEEEGPEASGTTEAAGDDLGCGEEGGEGEEAEAPASGGASCSAGAEATEEGPAGAVPEPEAASAAEGAGGPEPAGSVPSCAEPVDAAKDEPGAAESENEPTPGAEEGGKGSGQCATAQRTEEPNAGGEETPVQEQEEPDAAAPEPQPTGESESVTQRCPECGSDTRAQREQDAGSGEDAETQRAEDEPGRDESAQTCAACAARRRRMDTGTAARLIRARGAGEPLLPTVRKRLESTLGTDLEGVRVHADGNARAASRALRAKAFTHRNHIFLGPGQSQHDLGLMAHESAHVLQQDGIVRRKAAEPEPPESATLLRAADARRSAAVPAGAAGRRSSEGQGVRGAGNETSRDMSPPRGEGDMPAGGGGATLSLRRGPGNRELPTTRLRVGGRAPEARHPGPIATAGSPAATLSGTPLLSRGALALGSPPVLAAKPSALAAPLASASTAVAPASTAKSAPVPTAKPTAASDASAGPGAPAEAQGGMTAEGVPHAQRNGAAAPTRGRKAALPRVAEMPAVPPPPALELADPLVAEPPARQPRDAIPVGAPRYDAFRARALVDELVARLAEAGEERKSVHGARADAARIRIADDALLQERAAMGAAAEAERAIVAAVQGSRAAIVAHGNHFKALARIQATQGWTKLLKASSDESITLEQAKQRQQDAARGHVTRHQQEARQFGAEEGRRGRLAVTDQSNKALERGEVKARGYAADEAGQVQADAVRSVAARVSADLMKPAQDIENAAVEQGHQLADGFAGSADQIVSDMDEQARAAATQFSMAALEQLPVFQSLGTATDQAIDQLVVQVNGQLDTVESEARGEMGMVRLGLARQFAAAVQAAQGAVDGQLLAVDAATDAIVPRATGSVRRLGRPDPIGVREALRGVEATLAQASEGFDQGLGEMERATVDTFAQTSTTATNQLNQVARSTGAKLLLVTESTASGAAAICGKQGEEQENVLTKWTKGLTEGRTLVETEWSKAVKGVGDELEEGARKGRAPITRGVDDGVRKNAELLEALDGRMQEAAEEALYKYEHPIRYKLKRAIWAILEGLAKLVLVIAALFVGLVLLIAGLITGVVWAIVAGIVLLAVAIGYAIYSIVSGIVDRIKSATSVGEGIWGFFVGILDITGIPGIIEGIAERDLVNGRQLTLEEAGDRLGGGILGLATIIFPFTKGAKGRTRRTRLETAPDTRAVPDTPVAPQAPVKPPPVEPPAAKPSRIESPTVEAPRVEAPRAEAPAVEAPAPRVEPSRVEPPKTEPPKAETPGKQPGETAPGRPKESRATVAELERQLGKDGLTAEEIQGFYGGLHASELSQAAARRARALRDRFTTRDLKALGRYLYERDLILDDATTNALIKDVPPGKLESGLRSADIAEVLGKSKRKPGVGTEEGILEDPQARARVTDKPSPGRTPVAFLRGNFAHAFAEFLLDRIRLPRPSEAEVVVRLRDGTGKIIRTDRIIRTAEEGLLFEIKPRGRSARIGEAQLPGRLEALQREFPKPRGWQGRVVTYTRADLVAWLRREGLSAPAIRKLVRYLGFSTTGL